MGNVLGLCMSCVLQRQVKQKNSTKEKLKDNYSKRNLDLFWGDVELCVCVFATEQAYCFLCRQLPVCHPPVFFFMLGP